MNYAQHHRRPVVARWAAPFELALEQGRRLVLCARRSASWRRWIGFGAFLALLLWSAGTAGCSESGAAAQAPLKPTAGQVMRPQPAERPNLPPVNPAPARTPKEGPGYILTFEARANPFAPPKPEAKDGPTIIKASRAADVKLLGLMNDGTGSVAALEVDGKQDIVFAGMRWKSSSGADALHIVEIRESEVVVEQSGRQWIVSLPRP